MDEKQMQEEIARLAAEVDRLKSANDSLSKENANKKRELEAKMTEDEKRKSAQEELANRMKELETENAQLKRRDTLKSTWGKSITDNTVVEKIVELSLKGDDDGVSATIAEYYKAREDALKAEKAKEDMAKDQTPPPKSSDYAKMKLTDFLAMGDEGADKLAEIRAKNPALYNQILGNK